MMKSIASVSPLIESYLAATNRHDAAGFVALFAEEAIVDDVGREIRGRAAIREWSEREIFAVDVTLELLGADEQEEETVLRVEVDGTFDRTGLPDPLRMTHRIAVREGRIVRLTCRLEGA